MKKIITGMFMLAVTSMAVADSWTEYVKVVAVQPLVSWNGGMVRVSLDTPMNSELCSSGNAVVLDFLFSGGTQESRSAVVSALYVALATAKRARFFVSGTSCSPAGRPIILGVEVAD